MSILGDAPLRIRAAIRKRADGTEAPEDEYLARLVKLIPAEIVAFYLTFAEIASSWLDIFTWICLVLVVVVRKFGTQGITTPTQTAAVVIASISFVLWVYAIGGYLIQVSLPAGVIPVTVAVWTFLVPYFYKGDK